MAQPGWTGCWCARASCRRSRGIAGEFRSMSAWKAQGLASAARRRAPEERTRIRGESSRATDRCGRHRREKLGEFCHFTFDLRRLTGYFLQSPSETARFHYLGERSWPANATMTTTWTQPPRRRRDADDDDYDDRPRGTPPPNYLVQSILVTLCCCLIGGVVAIVYAAQVNSKWAAGDTAGARQASANAKMWCWVSFGIGNRHERDRGPCFK